MDLPLLLIREIWYLVLGLRTRKSFS